MMKMFGFPSFGTETYFVFISAFSVLSRVWRQREAQGDLLVAGCVSWEALVLFTMLLLLAW